MRLYIFSLIFIAIIYGLLFPRSAYAQDPVRPPASINEANQSNTTPNSTQGTEPDEELNAKLQKIAFDDQPLLPYIDILISITTGVTGKNSPRLPEIRNELGSLRPEGSKAPTDTTYEFINDTLSSPFFISADLRAYYKMIGIVLSYHRINLVSGSLSTGVKVVDVENENSGSFTGYTTSYRYLYSLIANAFSTELQVRQKIITQRVHLIFGLGYLYQAGMLTTELISVDDAATAPIIHTTPLSSHGVIARLEMSFRLRQIVIGTGLLYMYNNFNEFQIVTDLASSTYTVPRHIVSPYISVGLSF